MANKIQIRYPQIIVETKDIELTDFDLEQIEMGNVANIIWENLTEAEKDWLSSGSREENKQSLEAAIDAGYCGWNPISTPTTH